MTDVRVTTTEDAITGESVVRSITVLTFSGTVTSEGGSVTSVNSQTGAVVLDAADVGADPAGSATTAQTTAEAYADSKVAAEVTRADAAYDASGAAATAQSTAEAYTDAQVAALDAAAVGAVASVVAGDNITVDNTDPQNPVIASTASGTGSVSSDDITDATVVGKAVLTAADEAAARTAIGAGTSDLELGTTSTTALAGDTAIPDSPDDIGAATTAQGALADTAVQPADLATVATTGAYSDLSGTPTIPDSADDIGAVPTTRTVAGHALSADVTLVKGDVGLGNVDNTADTAKPVSTAQQAALDPKAPLASPALTGNPTAPTPTAGDNDTSIATTAFVHGEVAKQPEALVFALGDETTAITTGTKVTFRMPFAMTLTGVRASLTTASSSGNPAFDVKQGGTSIFSTTLTIDATEKTSTTAATAAVISTSALTDDAEITLVVNTAGTGAAGAKITLLGTRA